MTATSELESYLNSIVSLKLNKDEQQELINYINCKDDRGRIQKSHSQLNKYLQSHNIPYLIQAKRTNRARYWEVVHYISFEEYLYTFGTVEQVEKLIHEMSL